MISAGPPSPKSHSSPRVVPCRLWPGRIKTPGATDSVPTSTPPAAAALTPPQADENAAPSANARRFNSHHRPDRRVTISQRPNFNNSSQQQRERDNSGEVHSHIAALSPPPPIPDRHPGRHSLEEPRTEYRTRLAPVTERRSQESAVIGRETRLDSVENEYVRDGKEKAESPVQSEKSGSDEGGEDGDGPRVNKVRSRSEGGDDDGPDGGKPRSRSEGSVSTTSVLRPGQTNLPSRYRPSIPSAPNADMKQRSQDEGVNPGHSALGMMERLSVGSAGDPKAPHRPQPKPPRVQTPGPRQKRRPEKNENEDTDAITPAPPDFSNDDQSPLGSPSTSPEATPPRPRELSDAIKKQGGLTNNPAKNLEYINKVFQQPHVVKSPAPTTPVSTQLQPSQASPSPEQRRGLLERVFGRREQSQLRDLQRNSLALHHARLDQAAQQAREQDRLQSGADWEAEQERLRRASATPGQARAEAPQPSVELDELTAKVKEKTVLRFAQPPKGGNAQGAGKKDPSESDKAGESSEDVSRNGSNARAEAELERRENFPGIGKADESRKDVSRATSNAQSEQWKSSLAEPAAQGRDDVPALEAQNQPAVPQSQQQGRQRQQGGIKGRFMRMWDSIFAVFLIAIQCFGHIWGRVFR